MKEMDIRLPDRYDRYLALAAQDVDEIIDRDGLVAVPCPVCTSASSVPEFEKSGFTFVSCQSCDTVYVSPRPAPDQLARLYKDSKSTKYWIEEFFAPVAEARRERIFRPRAAWLAETYPEHGRGRIADIGAGFGLFLEELASVWPEAQLVGIEPSVAMAQRIRDRGIAVIEAMLEDLDDEVAPFDLLTAFELFEHLYEPEHFLGSVRRITKVGGLFVFTTLSGLGFDIQTQWRQSRSLSPPHHLNFANPFTIHRLLERVGFEVIESSSPGVLDWDIVESAWISTGYDPGRFWRTVSKYASDDQKGALQSWISASGFSSHMRITARAV